MNTRARGEHEQPFMHLRRPRRPRSPRTHVQQRRHPSAPGERVDDAGQAAVWVQAFMAHAVDGPQHVCTSPFAAELAAAYSVRPARSCVRLFENSVDGLRSRSTASGNSATRRLSSSASAVHRDTDGVSCSTAPAADGAQVDLLTGQEP